MNMRLFKPQFSNLLRWSTTKLEEELYKVLVVTYKVIKNYLLFIYKNILQKSSLHFADFK